MDNVFRFVQAGSEVSGLLGRLPSRVGYQPTLATEVAALHERIASVAGVSVTAIEAVYVPADDFTDPAVTAISSHLDSMIVLSRTMAAEGMYPAVDPLSSSSILLDPTVVGDVTQFQSGSSRTDLPVRILHAQPRSHSPRLRMLPDPVDLLANGSTGSRSRALRRRHFDPRDRRGTDDRVQRPLRRDRRNRRRPRIGAGRD